MAPSKRYSKQREKILDVVKHSEEHPTAEKVYEEVRKVLPKVSLGTVYRNLNLLTEEGRVRELILEDNVKRYDGNLSDHYHCICNSCGDIIDISFESHEMLENLSESINNFQIDDHKIEFYGQCDECNTEDHTAN
jgi:Fe2+ or Zn2+ uptake regulation protein